LQKNKGKELYKGLIVKNSLKNFEILDKFKILKTEIDDDWELIWIETDKAGIKIISNNLNSPKWYADFSDGAQGIVVFQNKVFEVNVNDEPSWADAIKYGISIGIPKEQLDFNFKY
jgi:hypothetical protein